MLGIETEYSDSIKSPTWLPMCCATWWYWLFRLNGSPFPWDTNWYICAIAGSENCRNENILMFYRMNSQICSDMSWVLWWGVRKGTLFGRAVGRSVCKTGWNCRWKEGQSYWKKKLIFVCPGHLPIYYKVFQKYVYTSHSYIIHYRI